MSKFKVRLFKIASTHKNLRTDTVEGVTSNLPQKGERFRIMGESLSPEANIRVVTTTEIKESVNIGDDFLFKTQNSTYCLSVLEAVNELS